MPDKLRWVALSERFPYRKPEEWEMLGIEWIDASQLWASVQEDAQKLREQLGY